MYSNVTIHGNCVFSIKINGNLKGTTPIKIKLETGHLYKLEGVPLDFDWVEVYRYFLLNEDIDIYVEYDPTFVDFLKRLFRWMLAGH